MFTVAARTPGIRFNCYSTPRKSSTDNIPQTSRTVFFIRHPSVEDSCRRRGGRRDETDAELFSIDGIVCPSEHQPSKEANDCEADYAVENPAKAKRGGGSDRVQVKAVHERTEKIDRCVRGDCERNGTQNTQEGKSHG